MRQIEVVNVRIGGPDGEIKTILKKDYNPDTMMFGNGISFLVPGDFFEKAGKPVEVEAPKVEEVLEDGLQCEVCGKLCKSPLGLKAHMRSHK